MNSCIKTRWLEALRSGTYEQGQGCLRSQRETYCPLGILCDIIDQKKWVAIARSYYEHDGRTGRPSKETLTEAGLSLDDVALIVQLSDRSKWTFEQVARWIEEKL